MAFPRFLLILSVLQAMWTVSSAAGTHGAFPGVLTNASASFEFGLIPGNGAPIRLRAPVFVEQARLRRPGLALEGDTALAQLKSLIAIAEAGRAGYDAVHYRAVRPPRPPSRMTLREIFHWVAATPGRPHAIGRYQFIPSTLRRLMDEAGLSPDTRFSPALQDHLADLLLEEAGMSDFLRGEISDARFMDNLALIWAGLPTSAGVSAYHGYAGNRATISRRDFEAAMGRIFR